MSNKREIAKIAREIKSIKAQVLGWATSVEVSRDFVEAGFDTLSPDVKKISRFFPKTFEGSGEAAMEIGPVDSFGYMHWAEDSREPFGDYEFDLDLAYSIPNIYVVFTGDYRKDQKMFFQAIKKVERIVREREL